MNRTTHLCWLTVAVIGLADYVTGSRLSFGAFYLVPVIAAAYWAPRGAAFGVVIAATATWLTAELASTGAAHVGVSVWNAGSRAVSFGAVALLASRWRDERVRLAAANRELERLLARESELARKDTLTGLPNGRAFGEELDRVIARARRDRRAVSVVYFDLDGFKAINDEHGHAEGDRVLCAVAGVVRELTRGGDVPARLAGDEFALLLHDGSEDTARAVAHRLIDRIAAIDAPSSRLRVGASAGVAVVHRPRTREAVLEVADAAMYEAKSAGKGCVVVHTHRGRRAVSVGVPIAVPAALSGGLVASCKSTGAAQRDHR